MPNLLAWITTCPACGVMEMFEEDAPIVRAYVMFVDNANSTPLKDLTCPNCGGGFHPRFTKIRLPINDGQEVG